MSSPTFSLFISLMYSWFFLNVFSTAEWCDRIPPMVKGLSGRREENQFLSEQKFYTQNQLESETKLKSLRSLLDHF